MASALISPLQVPAAYLVVVDRLRRVITLGEVLPGDHLPSERALAEGFAVSRLTVREALRTLQGEGLIETRRSNRGGAKVLESAITPAMRRGRLRESANEMRTIHELRAAVEPMAARLAATRRTPDDVQALRDIDRRIRDSSSIGVFRQADSAFHLAVADAAGNARLRRAIEDARSELFVALDAQNYEVLAAESADGHELIVDAIDAGDDQRAADAMAAHLRHAWTEISSVIDG